MLDAGLSIADEVEAAISAGSAEKSLETIKRVTDLFLLSAGSLNGEQIELFDDVLERLIKTIEIRAIVDVSARIALAEVSTQLAGVSKAPPLVVRRLARHDEIAIAGPVLTESARLGTEDLVELAGTKSEQHLLAISGRWWLDEVVTDALLARHYPAVSRRLMNNPGARVSAAGFATVIAQAEADPELAVETGIRVDLPTALRHQLLRSATEAVRSRLLSRAPRHVFEEIRSAIAAASAAADGEMSRVRDFDTAKRLVTSLKKSGELNEAALFGFAKQRRYEETVAALAELSRSTVDVIRPLMQSLRDDGVLIPCKAAELGWETVSAVLESRFVNGSMGPHELAKAKNQFAKLTAENARRLLKFWQVRSFPSSSNVN
ncbi:DUF2336 domain-containing protein [Bradyrhizobium canariense]|uniref:Uncharacterized conserved protein, DUF2336 family n=1 Tax=Bradyrhizobium canariense TaxID=255045 RepID=A0A1H1W9J0_9BRAD|nr:DUF2336 domain-containing protein [Bradyrhizobium canariense]SDS93331.1 Uncharacterized conserved protein, DUF2336 family [Bradyrhizobium canariense]